MALPGIGDHDLVLVETSIMPRRQKPAKRKIYLWKTADLPSMKKECLNFQKEFLENFKTHRAVPAMWDNIKVFLNQLQDKHVPSKMSSTRFHQAWITTSLKRLTRKKKKSFIRAKRSQSPTDFLWYKQLKKEAKSACKRAYNDYVTNIVSPDSSVNPKRFWSYIKSKRCDFSGVAPLKSTDGITYSDSLSKANILNCQFVSVFTNEVNKQVIKVKENPHPPMSEITITSAGVYKLLSELKSTRPLVLTNYLQDYSKHWPQSLLQSSPSFIRNPLTKESFLMTGEKQMLHLFSKKVTKTDQKTTGLSP